MEIEGRETLTPAQANDIGWPLRDSDVALIYRLRCRRGCIGTFRMPVNRELADDAEFMAGVTESVLDFADTHVCLRKAAAGDRHRCVACAWTDSVNRRGMLREHVREVWAAEGVMREFGPLSTERCPGAGMLPGRRVA